MFKYDQIIKCISPKFFCTAVLILFCPKSCQDVTPTLFVYLSFLDHIKFCKVVLNIFKVNMENSVHSEYFSFYLK